LSAGVRSGLGDVYFRPAINLFPKLLASVWDDALPSHFRFVLNSGFTHTPDPESSDPESS